MPTPGALLSVLFMATLIIDHGNKAEEQSNNKTEIGKPSNKMNLIATPKKGNASAQGQQPKRFLPWNFTFEDTLIQDPRFAGIRKGQGIRITCGCSKHRPQNANITWFLGNQDGSFISYVLDTDPNVQIQENWLTIIKVQAKHNGIYFCNYTRNGVNRVPCGTELMVLGSGNQATAKSRNTMKDVIIMIQTILIVSFIAVPAMLLMEMKKKRSLKIEDHTYEGLEAYQTATYEDIQTVRVLAAKTMEGEHPCVE